MAKVLIIDDDRNLRGTLRELLESTGHSARAAANGEEAFALLQTETPGLILCDWKMPGMGGEQFLRSLQSEGLLTSMPVLIMTAHGTGPNAMQAMKLGAYDFITKPLDMDDVLATVARALRHMELQHEVEQLRAQRFRDQPSSTQDSQGGFAEKKHLIGNSPAWIEVFKSIGKESPAREKRAWRALSTRTADGTSGHSPSSTALHFPVICLSPNCSAMNEAHLPAP